MNSKTIGDLSECATLKAFLAAGISVSIPWGDNQTYDLIADIAGRLWKVQCKTGKLSDKGGRLHYSTSRVFYDKALGKHRRHPYPPGSVDLFSVYSREEDRVFLVEVSEAKGVLSLVGEADLQTVVKNLGG